MNTVQTIESIDTRTTHISAKSASVITISMAVYNFVKNECIYYGDVDSSKKLEATSNSLIAVSL